VTKKKKSSLSKQIVRNVFADETILETKLIVTIKKETNRKTNKSFSLYKLSKQQRVLSYWGIAQHTIVTLPVLPGNDPNCPLPMPG
jgi:hypothetical protein